MVNKSKIYCGRKTMLLKIGSKKVFLILLSMILVISNILPVMASFVQLTDIAGNPYEKAINNWVDNGYIKGNPK
jgi:hypothetical protein